MLRTAGFIFTAGQPWLDLQQTELRRSIATNAGNATLTNALLHLGQVLGNTNVFGRGDKYLRWARAAMERYLANHCSFISALQSASRRTKPLSYADRIQTCGIGGKRFAKVISHGSPSTACPTISQDRYLIIFLACQCSNAQPSERLCL